MGYSPCIVANFGHFQNAVIFRILGVFWSGFLHTNPFHLLSCVHINEQFPYIYICHRVPVISSMWYAQVRFGTLPIWQLLAFLKQHSFQNSERLLKSCCAPYGTCCFVLTHDSWHFRMRWTNEIAHFLVSFPYSFVSVFRQRFFVVVVVVFFQNKAFYL